MMFLPSILVFKKVIYYADVGNEHSTLFWRESWFDGISLKVVVGWEVNDEAWKWHMRLFAWEEELLGECVKFLHSFVLQVDLPDR